MARINFFGDTTHLQSMADQVGLALQPGPLPIAVSGNVQYWPTGPSMLDLYTESAQGFYRLDDNWKILAQQLYQQQGSITLYNLVTGFNYQPNDDLSINLTGGFGVHTRYTYQWSAYVAPQYRLPWEIGGKQRVSLEADMTYEQYQLGTFSQVIPKANLNLATWLPRLALGYALGAFRNATAVSVTQYYQPQIVNGTVLGAVAHPLENVYLVLSCLPANRNYIAGNYVTQNTIGGTIHWNLTSRLRLSFFGQGTWYQRGSDVALGGGINWRF